MKYTYYSILRITTILLLSLLFVAISAHADFDNEKYMKVYIRNVVDSLNDNIPEFVNDSFIIYQEDDQIVTDNLSGLVITICFQNYSGIDIECYNMNPGERIQHNIPVSSYQYVVKSENTVRDIVVLAPHTPVPSITTYGIILLLLLLVVSTVFVMRKRASGAVNL